MDLLFLVPYVPNLIRVRPYNLIRSLTARGHRVTVMTLSTGEEDDLAKLKDLCHRVYAYDLPTWRSFYNALTAIPTATPLQAMYCWQPALAHRSTQIIKNGNEKIPYDVIHIEHLRGACYGLHLKEHLNNLDLQVPFVWDSVDCITHLFDQAAARSQKKISRWLTRFELGRTRDYEGFLIRQFDRVLVTSQVDQQALLSLAPSDSPPPSISVLPNGVDLAYFSPDDRVARQDATLVVSGKMSYHANVTMVLALVNQILPLVRKGRPEVNLWIVGKDPTSQIKNLARDPAITVTGTVDDIRPYLRAASIAVAPIQYGAGIQNKILEAMACGAPVISTSQAISALEAQPGQDLLVADPPAEFAGTILALLDDREQQRKLSAAGRRYVEQHHNWDHIAAQLEEIYLAAIDDKQKIKSF
jgi:sugar transferase (PEP-CTERM/EpsH1 system associated)